MGLRESLLRDGVELLRPHEPVIRCVLERHDRGVDVVLGERIFLVLETNSIDLPQLLLKDCVEKHARQPTAAQLDRLCRRQICVSQIL